MFNLGIFHLLALVKKFGIGMDIVPYPKGKRERGRVAVLQAARDLSQQRHRFSNAVHRDATRSSKGEIRHSSLSILKNNSIK
jgi:hypothetical protein